MTRKLSIMITWQFDMKRQDAIELAKIADQSGVDSFWVPEGWAGSWVGNGTLRLVRA